MLHNGYESCGFFIEMKDTSILLTAKGYKTLEQEYEQLTKVERPDVLKQVQKARALGDLRENAAYHAARDKLAFIQGRIDELKHILGQAQVIAPQVGEASEEVLVGSEVKLGVNNSMKEFKIVSEHEADIRNAKISSSSPLGQALLGKKAGDTVKLMVPVGIVEYQIVSIS